MNSKKKSKLKLAQDEAQAAINKTRVSNMFDNIKKYVV